MRGNGDWRQERGREKRLRGEEREERRLEWLVHGSRFTTSMDNDYLIRKGNFSFSLCTPEEEDCRVKIGEPARE